MSTSSSGPSRPADDWPGWRAPAIDSVPAGPCAVCGGVRFVPEAQGYDYEIATCSNLWSLVRCTGCSHVQLDPRPAPQALSTIYPSTYYSYNMAQRLSAWIVWGKSVLDKARLNRILAVLGRPARSYLDAGCGDGKYLRTMRAKGMDAASIHGVELDPAAIDRLKAEGFNAECATIEGAITPPAGAIDVITLFHVIEHLPDPAAAVTKMVQWLSPGGILALETPNRDSLDARWFRKSFWGGYHIPRHWHLFDTAGICRLLEQHGLRVVETRYVSGHSFWLYSFHHALAFNHVLPMPRLARLFDPMRSKLALVAVTAFDYARAMLGFRTSSVLVIARKM